MKRSIRVFSVVLVFLAISQVGITQVNEDKLGAWYMYFFNGTFTDSSSLGFQGDVQYRNWNLGGDLEQLLIRGGVSYKPRWSQMKFTLGYGNITTGNYAESSETSSEHRIYQELLFSVPLATRLYSNHRFRFEQRFVDNQDFRSRYRYNIFLNIPLNKIEVTSKTLYLSLYNELFINAQQNIGNGQSVEFFDRNRLYCAIGYCFKKGTKVQLGVMKQSTMNWTKEQLQVSFHHTL